MPQIRVAVSIGAVKETGLIRRKSARFERLVVLRCLLLLFGRIVAASRCLFQSCGISVFCNGSAGLVCLACLACLAAETADLLFV